MKVQPNNRRILIFGLLLLVFSGFIFFTDSDLRDPSGIKWIVMGVGIGLFLTAFMWLLNRKRPDLFYKWFPEHKFIERLSSNPNKNDLKAVSEEFAHWFLDSTILGYVAGAIVLVFVFGFVWYAKTFLGL